VADRPLRPATDRRLGGLLPRQLANRPQAPLEAPEFSPSHFPVSWQYAVLAVVSNCYPPLQGRSPTSYSPVRHFQKYCYFLTFDLHVLGTPPAFILSQDQTLHQELNRVSSSDDSLIESAKSLSQNHYCLTTLQLLMCWNSQALYFSTSSAHSSLAIQLCPRKRKYVLYHRRTRLSNLLANFALIYSALWRLAHPTLRFNCRADRITHVTHCVTNPHLTTLGLVPQIRLTLFFLKFCVFRNAWDNNSLSLPTVACVRHKSVDYHHFYPRSNLGAGRFI
jgi:hypothetical protein